MNKFEKCKDCGEGYTHKHKCPPAWVCHHEYYSEEGKIFYGVGPDDAAIRMVQEINEDYEFVGQTITVEVEVDGTLVPYKVSIQPTIDYSITT